MTSRELVYKTLEFENFKGRAPRQLWALPWAKNTYPEERDAIDRDFPADIAGPAVAYKEKGIAHGEVYEIGESVDDWGCRFRNIQRGVHGEVMEPIVSPDDENWDDTGRVHFPYEWFSFDADEDNRFCKSTYKFTMGGCCPRPFEQLQFMRGSQQLFVDLALQLPGFFAFLKKMHAFYCELLEKWAKTDVDGLNMMDDWGTQRGLLIHPETWVKIFKPMYKDYIDIAHRHNKKMFMHSDGHTLAIYPHLVELGLDAFNSQIFCMGVEKLVPYRGKICFWGEIDRQHLLPSPDVNDVKKAVEKVHGALWHNGGCIAQCEFGAGARPQNVRAVFETWNKLTGGGND